MGLDLKDAEDVKRLREELRTRDKHEALRNWRDVRDRAMDGRLGVFGGVLGEAYNKAFTPVQSQEPDQEIQDRKHILVANETEIECVVKTTESGVRDKAQKLQDALDAVLDQLFPIEVAEDEVDAILGDGAAVICIERIPSTALAGYADREALEYDAEQPDEEDGHDCDDCAFFRGDGTPCAVVSAPVSADGTCDWWTDDEGKTPPRRKLSPDAAHYRDDADITTRRQAVPRQARDRYRAAYAKAGNHAKAYRQATSDAEKEGGFTYRGRVVDRETFWGWEDQPYELAIGMEDGDMPLAPVLDVIGGFGWHADEDGCFFKLQKENKDTGMLALGVSLHPLKEGVSEFLTSNKVRYTRIADRDTVYVLVEHMKGETACQDCESPFLTFEGIMAGRSTAYYVVPGDTKARGNTMDRYKPPVLGQLVMAELSNIVDTANLTMAIYEASRTPLQNMPAPTQAGAPLDPTLDAKSRVGKDGRPQPTVAGEVTMEPSSEIDMMKLRQMIDEQTQRYRSHDFMVGSGSAGEPAAHLALMQTAYLTTMTPIQMRRAAARKRILEDLLASWAKSGETQYVPYLPKGPNRTHEVRVAAPREITPEMAALPVALRVTIGAESPATKWAREQAVRSQIEFGMISMTTGMEEAGVKDPDFEWERKLKDNARALAIGTPMQPGRFAIYVEQLVEQYVTQAMQTMYPAAPPPPPAGAPMGGPMGNPMAGGTDQGPGMTPPGTMANPAPVLSNGGTPTAAAAPPGVVG
ncbi:MAG: hypothetical protein KGK07_12845 [Chloroflexota bacterium]|nr:hypothetical protein [Chloroflexota bacterium]